MDTTIAFTPTSKPGILKKPTPISDKPKNKPIAQRLARIIGKKTVVSFCDIPEIRFMGGEEGSEGKEEKEDEKTIEEGKGEGNEEKVEEIIEKGEGKRRRRVTKRKRNLEKKMVVLGERKGRGSKRGAKKNGS
ncbi:hypothetical protein ONS95_004528 [Cadophora gregata]|uniref:uncharacterized protein n=1 Tax=Cadophora gregata TaxID=51156 RepID=UPI0026DC8391|nr:uncharacterized protein ONS95_004528 [Cadophora gregata]KAK0105109.1 hypothetical protein ONS96_004512 [Cadophora gregata f. sp. sojae]KAK0106022.1 hypothetical protein ONS95_004528 [Cadophora gregata]